MINRGPKDVGHALQRCHRPDQRCEEKVGRHSRKEVGNRDASRLKKWALNTHNHFAWLCLLLDNRKVAKWGTKSSVTRSRPSKQVWRFSYKSKRPIDADQAGRFEGPTKRQNYGQKEWGSEGRGLWQRCHSRRIFFLQITFFPMFLLSSLVIPKMCFYIFQEHKEHVWSIFMFSRSIKNMSDLFLYFLEA